MGWDVRYVRTTYDHPLRTYDLNARTLVRVKFAPITLVRRRHDVRCQTRIMDVRCSYVRIIHVVLLEEDAS